MKKLFPYLCALGLGIAFSFLLFKGEDFSLKEVFSENITATAFQLGVFNNEISALQLKNKYEGAIMMKEDDVYRVYYSILTNPAVITKMEKYLSEQKINYYLKTITVKDSNLIKALNEYEKTMIEGSDSVLTSVNKLITSSYGGGV